MHPETGAFLNYRDTCFDMIIDKKNNLERLSAKQNELIKRTKIVESVYDMFRQGGVDDVREKLVDVMYENQKFREENMTLKELLGRAFGIVSRKQNKTYVCATKY